MTKKIMLTRDGYGGLPYPAGSVLAIEDDEGAFIINSGSAFYVDENTEVTPVPEPPVLQAASEAAKKAEEDRLKAMLPSERHKAEEIKKQAEEDRKWREEDQKAKDKLAKETREAEEKAAKDAANKLEHHDDNDKKVAAHSKK